MKWPAFVLLIVIAGASAAAQRTPDTTQAGRFVFTAVGDIGSDAEALATLDLIRPAKPDFHLALGDFSYTTEPETVWCDLVKKRVGPAFPFQLVVGNHEDDFGEDGHITRFAQCLPDRIGVTGQYPMQYLFDYRKLARFIVISPDLTVSGRHYYYGAGNADFKWVAGAIDDARAAGIPWVIVAMHKSCLSMGEYYCHIYADLMNLLVERKVDLILQAHDHSYQRTKQLALSALCPSIAIDAFNANCVVASASRDKYVKGAGAVQMIVATGGGRLYPLNTADTEAGYFARWMDAKTEARKGILRFEVDKDRISAAFVGAPSSSRFSDRFTIAARGR